MFSWFPTKGFLGTGATFGADLNLIAQVVMGVALVAGFILARQKHYRAHGICQSTVMLLNLLMIGSVMWPSFHQQVIPTIPRMFRKWYVAAAVIHGISGMAAQLLGLYIVMVAGTNVLPQRLRFQRWKLWMRIELVLWMVLLVSGLATYCAWYIVPFQ